jgi:hypothetical protein
MWRRGSVTHFLEFLLPSLSGVGLANGVGFVRFLLQQDATAAHAALRAATIASSLSFCRAATRRFLCIGGCLAAEA